jgi:hypothetical protein
MDHSLHYPHLIVTVMMQTQIKPSKKYTRSYIEGQQKMHAKNFLDKLDMRKFPAASSLENGLWRTQCTFKIHQAIQFHQIHLSPSEHSLRGEQVYSFCRLYEDPEEGNNNAKSYADADLSLSPNDSDMPNMYYYSN